VKLLLCDVDGVLTNATVFMGQGAEFKEFHIQDGLGLRLLQREGIKVGWISNRPSPATQQRAEDLKIDFLQQSTGSKVSVAESILAQAAVGWKEVCYVGDDIVDLGVLKRAGVAVVVANGIAEAKALADYVTRAEGGRGAVREVVGLILRAQGKWTRLVREFSA
jgi:3-deoxy-D-manno-octulosonate 8-phosphate phosphatase (KDO 8-P phosphatase)